MGGITRKKIWTSLCVVPPLFFLIAVGPPVILFLIVFAATFFGLREFYGLALPQSKGTERIVGIGLGLALTLAIFCADIDLPSIYLVLLLLLLSLLFMVTSQDLSTAVSKMGMTLFGILYIAFLLSSYFVDPKYGFGQPVDPFSDRHGLGGRYCSLSSPAH